MGAGTGTGTGSYDGCGDRDKKSKFDGDRIEIINGDRDGESKILPKSDPFPSLLATSPCKLDF